MPPEVSKLIAAVTTLVSALNESAGLPSTSPDPTDDRFDSKKEKVATAPGLLVRFQEPQMSDKVWNKVAQIFAKNFEKLSSKPDYDEERLSIFKEESPTDDTLPILQQATGGIVNLQEPQEGDRTWNKIAQIFARNFEKLTDKPDYGEEESKDSPSIIQQYLGGEKEVQKSFFSKLMEYLVPLAAVVGGIALSFAGGFSGPGVVGNTLNTLGKLITGYGQKYLVSWGKSLVSLGDELLQGTSKFLQGGLKLLGGGGGSLGKVLGGIASKVGGFFLKTAKFLPFVGSAFSFYFAYKRFQEGDYIGSIMEVASGILNLTGLQWIGILIDVALIARDFTTTKEERAEQSGFIGKFFTGIKDWFAKNGMTILRSLPFVGSLMYLWDAYKAGFTTPEGIKNFLKGFGTLTGLGAILSPAIDFLFSLFEEKEDSESDSASPKKPFWQSVKEFVKRAMDKLPLWIRKPLEWLGILSSTDTEIPNENEPQPQSVEQVSNNMPQEESAPSPSPPAAVQNISNDIPLKDTTVEIDDQIGNLPKDTAKVGFVANSQEIDNFLNDNTTLKLATDNQINNLPKDNLKVRFVVDNQEVDNFINKYATVELAIDSEILSNLPKDVDIYKTELMSISNAIKSVNDTVKSRVDTIVNNLEAKTQETKNAVISIIDNVQFANEKIIDWTTNMLYWMIGRTAAYATNLSNPFAIWNINDRTGLNLSSSKDQEIKIKSPTMDIIAFYSKRQVELLESINSKIDNISTGSPAPAGPAAAASGPPLAGDGASINRGFSSSSLLPVGTIGSIV